MKPDQAPTTKSVRRRRVGVWSMVHGYSIFIWSASVAIATDAPIVVPAQGDPYAAELEAVGPDGRVTFRATNGDVVDYRTLPLEKLVRWSHPRPSKAQTLVLLRDGSRLVTAAEWSGGAAVRLNGDTLVVLSDTWDEVTLKPALVGGIVFAQRSSAEQRMRLENQVRSANDAHDQILLANGDRLVGTLKRLDRGTLVLTTEAGDAELPLSRVDAVVFASTADKVGQSQRSRDSDARIAIGLRDGSLLHAKSVVADKDELKIELADQVPLVGGTRDDVAFLQSLDGDFVYLSDLEPADYRHVPYLTIPWAYQRDRNALGEPLAVDGETYLKGLGMHSAGRLTYKLDSIYARFDASIAIDEAANSRGSVVFGVHVLRGGKWQEAFRSNTIRGGDPPQRVSVDLNGARALTLTVDYAERGDELDYADWLDARLEK